MLSLPNLGNLELLFELLSWVHGQVREEYETMAREIREAADQEVQQAAAMANSAAKVGANSSLHIFIYYLFRF